MVDDTFKNAVLDVLPSNEAPDVGLDVAPSADTEMVPCVACGCGDCEAWEPEPGMKVAKCPVCQAEFPVTVVESASKRSILNIFEKRLRLRRQVHAPAAKADSVQRQDAAKDEVSRLLGV